MKEWQKFFAIPSLFLILYLLKEIVIARPARVSTPEHGECHEVAMVDPVKVLR